MSDILICDDEPVVVDTFARILTIEQHAVRSAGSVSELLKRTEESSVDIVLLDLHLPDGRGDELIPELLRRDPLLQVIVISGDEAPESIVSATRSGALHYLTKPVLRHRLLSAVNDALAVRNAMRSKEAERRVHNLTRSAKSWRLAGTSSQICSVNLMLQRVAKSGSAPVLITGESGTGKELAAETIHHDSPRASGPLIKVNCAAIPPHLIEDEFFGHEKGAFTTAIESRRGLFELADGGTIFLDEIGELHISLQPKLLRVLEDRTILRIGGSKPRDVDVRIVAATNRDLPRMCRHAQFREDLFFRLAVLQIQMPTLRERPEDIVLLANRFLHEMNLKLGKHLQGFSADVMDCFINYRWPGNVRELVNLIERLVLLSDHSVPLITKTLLDEYGLLWAKETGSDHDVDSRHGSSPPRGGSGVGGTSAFRLTTIDQVEEDHIRKTLEALRFNKTRVANALGISRSTLRRKISRYNLDEWVEANSTED